MDMLQQVTGEKNSKSVMNRLDVFGVRPLHVAVFRGHFFFLPFLLGFIEYEDFDATFGSESLTATRLAEITNCSFEMKMSLIFVREQLEVQHFYRLDPSEYEQFTGYRKVYQKFKNKRSGGSFMKALGKHNINQPFPNTPPHFTPLYVAVLTDNVEAVKLLLAKGANVHHYISNGDYNLLHAAARHDRYRIIPLLIKAGASLTERNPSQRTPFCIAARWGHLASMKAISNSQKFNLATSNGNLALFCAAQEGQFHVIPTLVHLGCDMEYRVKPFNQTPLHVSVIHNHSGVVRTLLALGAEPSPLDAVKNTPLHIAAINGSSDVIKPLLEFGSSLYNVNSLLLTPPEEAVLNNEFGFLRAAMDHHGYDVNTQDQFGYTLLHTMIMLRHSVSDQVLEKLVQTDCDSNAPIEEDLFAIHWATQYYPSVQVLKKLVGMGCDLNAPMEEGLLPIHFATQHNDTEAIRAFVELGSDVDVPTLSEKRRHPIHIAAGLNCVEAIEVLTELGCDIEAQQSTKLKLRPLHLTVLHRSQEAFRKLMEKGADIHSKISNGMTAIFFAVLQNAFEMIKVLVQNGSKIDDTYDLLSDSATMFMRSALSASSSQLLITPLIFAIICRRRKCVVELLELGASTADTFLQLSSLQIAAQRGQHEIAGDLIDHGANVNRSREGDGFTPLHFAIMENHIRVVRVLVTKGCDVTKPTFRNSNPDLTPLQLASLMCRSAIVRMIGQHVPDINQLTEEGLSPLHLALLNPTIRTSTKVGEVTFPAVSEEDTDCYEEERARTVDILMKMEGIELSLTDVEDITPLDIAVQKKLKDIVFSLVEAWGLRGETKKTIDQLQARIDYLEGVRQTEPEKHTTPSTHLDPIIAAMQEEINQLRAVVDDLRGNQPDKQGKLSSFYVTTTIHSTCILRTYRRMYIHIIYDTCIHIYIMLYATACVVHTTYVHTLRDACNMYATYMLHVHVL